MAELPDDQGLLARALSTLGRARASGVLRVRAPGGRRAEIRVASGRLASIECAESGTQVVGDLLVSEGAVAATQCIDDAGRLPNEPIGAFLVRKGRVTGGALTHAMRVQTRARLALIIAWPSADLEFAAADSRAPSSDDLPTMQDSLMHAIRCTNSHGSASGVLRELGHEPVRLSEFGRELTSGASLRPEEVAVVAMLSRGVSGSDLIATFGANRRALAFAVALRRMRAIEPSASTARYSLLLRKHRELRRSSDATKLLDVEKNATPDEARRALRRLARDLHPDRFGGRNDVAARAVSAEVFQALVLAESHVSREHGARASRRAR